MLEFLFLLFRKVADLGTHDVATRRHFDAGSLTKRKGLCGTNYTIRKVVTGP
jgi:hypothetical protein